MIPPAKITEHQLHGECAVRNSNTMIHSLLPIPAFSRLGGYCAPLLILMADYIAVVLALSIAWYLRADLLPVLFTGLKPFAIADAYILYVIPLCYLFFLAYEGMYSKRLPFWQGAEYLFKISTYVTGLMFAISYFTVGLDHISRIFILLTGLLSFILLAILRYCTKRVLLAGGLWEKPVIIVGTKKTGELLVKAFADDPNLGYKVVGLIEDDYEGSFIGQYPYVGNFAQAEQVLVNSRVEDIVIAAPGIAHEDLVDMVYRIQPHVKNIIIVPNLLGFPLRNVSSQTLFDEKIMMLSVRNNMMIRYNRIVKRGFDFICSLIGTVLIMPILMIIGAAIYIDSPGPIIFAHNRIGSKGKLFPCYKFRSMIPDAQKVLDEYLKNNPNARVEWECDFKLKEDPRITKVGKFLRKTSLDEFPQLLNVIKGEMSLVGPRPIIDKEIPKYGGYIKDYLMVRPGMTGFWQVNGRNDIDYDSRVQMDSWYVRNWSVWLDIVLLCKTVKVVMLRKGAY